MKNKVANTTVAKAAKALIITSAFIAGLSGCARGYQYGRGESGVGDSVRFYGSNISAEQEKELLAKNTYYFGYDQFEVPEEDTLSIYAHAKRIADHSRAQVRVEGHTDERGSREYNIALGERRALAVKNILMLKGVNPNQISVVSYGKEKPASIGSGEQNWKLNRRATIVYEKE